jgi:hypothetical protein
MRVLVALLLLTSAAFAQGAKPGEGVLRHNRQFVFGDYLDGPFARTVYSTLEALRTRGICEGEPPRCMLITAEGVDDIQQTRATRVQRNLQGPMMRVDGPNGQPMWRNWFETVGFGFARGDSFIDVDGRSWRIHKLLLDEMVTTGLAVHRWRCEPRNKPIIEMQLRTFTIEDMDEFCARTNAEAREVFGLLNGRSAGGP